ncbi:UDP-N-acetylglucosamine 4,6-dehydratase family protein [Flavobacterium rivuli]|uniref:UDP-N-acetylglucosamine 4,6-dehydratase family protein n=1 Tax=Flavobacterium rivuli TaxID=498301 RepID=UPI00037B2649|nr:nucleoside-diphosphate sugar epimerase/dehydratase [Flavobacterium rivuli]
MKQVNYQLEDLLDRKPILLDSQSISAQLKDKVVLITGAAGSIGSEIVRQVIDFSPKCVIMLDQAETPLYLLELEVGVMMPNARFYSEIADVKDKNAVNEVFKKYRPNVVYHAAAYKHVQMMEKNPSQAIMVNVLGTKNVADCANLYNVDTFVLISTDKAVNPGSIMGASKLVAEKYVQALHEKLVHQEKESATKYLITRFGNVLGSNGSVVPVFAKQIQDGGPVTVTHPDITRFFMTIKEACQLVLEAGAMGKGGEIYIFDMGKQVKIIDLALKMIRMAGLEPDKDIKIKYVGLRPGEKLYEELVTDTSKMLPTHNDNIMISREEPQDYDVINVSINKMITLAQQFNVFEAVAEMKKIVPEFISLNSEFKGLEL